MSIQDGRCECGGALEEFAQPAKWVWPGGMSFLYTHFHRCTWRPGVYAKLYRPGGAIPPDATQPQLDAMLAAVGGVARPFTDEIVQRTVDKLSRVPAKKIEDWPCRCPRCGRDKSAILLFSSWDCRNGCFSKGAS